MKVAVLHSERLHEFNSRFILGLSELFVVIKDVSATVFSLSVHTGTHVCAFGVPKEVTCSLFNKRT